jgi:hypothetical protein
VVDLNRIINRITANEARAYLSNDWCEKLNEIYDGVRATLENEGNYYEFQLDESKPYTNEIVLKALELDGYRIVKHSSVAHRIYW